MMYNKQNKQFKIHFYVFLLLIMNIAWHANATTKNTAIIDIHPSVKVISEKTKNSRFSLLVKSTTNEEYLAGEANGNIYALNKAPANDNAVLPSDNKLEEHLTSRDLINVKQYYPTLLSLTALTLHPNFHFKEKHGHLVFYTAHIETTNPDIKTPRINDSSEQLPFEAVLTEWQMATTHEDDLTVFYDSHREVLRIPTPSAKVNISQLLFNPYVKPWQENYALLHIVLTADPLRPTSALFSGSILKINPDKFGFKSYSIPQNNPFLGNDSVHDEIINTGLGQINSINWAKDSHHYLLTSLIEDDQKLSFYKLTVGDDWRDTAKKPENFYQSQSAFYSNSVLYRGKDITGIRNQLVYLTQLNNRWQLLAISFTTPFEIKPLALFPDDLLAKEAQPILFINHQNELTIFDKGTHVFFAISPASSTIGTKNPLVQDQKIDSEKAQKSTEKIDEETSSLNKLVYVVVLLIILTAFFLTFGHHNQLAKIKKLLHKQYAKYEVDPSLKTIKLYKRHQKDVDLTLKQEEIEQSEIFLNDQLINTINADKGQHFSAKHEKHINYHIDREKREKMVTHKTRKIDLVLQDKQQKKYIICVYLREGNQRLTKAKFDEVINALIDWCWLISATINPDTKTREVPKPSAVLNENKITNGAIIHNTSSASHTMASHADSIVDVAQKKDIKLTADISQNNIAQNNQNDLEDTKLQHANTDSAAMAQNMNDIELINALEKLANLKNQGLLTDDEFTEAKVKIMNKLT